MVVVSEWDATCGCVEFLGRGQRVDLAHESCNSSTTPTHSIHSLYTQPTLLDHPFMRPVAASSMLSHSYSRRRHAPMLASTHSTAHFPCANDAQLCPTAAWLIQP